MFIYAFLSLSILVKKMLIKVYSYDKSIFIAHIVEGLCVYFLRLYAIFQCPYNVTFISLPL